MGQEESEMTPKNLELQTRSNIVTQTDVYLLPTSDLGSYLRRPGRSSVRSAVAEMISHYDHTDIATLHKPK